MTPVLSQTEISPAPPPASEPSGVLEAYMLVEPDPDPAFDDITRLAALLCNAAASLIAFLSPDGLLFPATFGLTILDAPRGLPAFEKTIAGEGVYEIADARADPAYKPGILLAGQSFGFYAGTPITTPSGAVVGCLSVLDPRTGRLSDAQVDGLAALARQIVTRLERNSRIRQMERAARARQRAEDALTVEQNFVSAVLDTAGALVAVYDPDGRIVRFNRACEAACGYEFSTLAGRFPWEKIVPEEDVEQAIAEFKQLRAGPFPATFENFWLREDGSRRRIAWSATALLDPQGEVSFIIATGIDVTGQRAAEATLRESEARYRQLIEGSLGIVCTHDLEGVLLSINSHGASTIGLTPGEMVGHNLAHFLDPQSTGEFPPYLEELQRTGEAQGLFHLAHIHQDVHVVAYRNKLIHVPGHDPYVLGFGVDISEQKRAEDKLSTLIRQSDSVLRSIGDGIYGLDLHGRVTVINPAAAQMLGYKPHELLGVNFHQLIHHKYADGTAYPVEACPIGRTMVDRSTIRVDNEVFWRKDGSSFPVEYVACPQISWDAGERGEQAVGVVVAFTDTTERRALDRMKDEFISTVSHELRTPLTSVRAALGLISGGALDDRPQKAKQMLDLAIANTDRLSRLVNDILDLERIASGKAELQSSLCSADDLLRRAAALQETGATRAGIQISIDAPGVELWADPDRILQALTNLLSNAIKFSPPASTVALIARRLDEAEAEIVVSDRGRGIPQDMLERIFERFQQVDASDSRAMGGTGLGLAICRSIVQQHGGRIWTASVLGEGSSFHFTLPTRAPNNLR